MMNKDQIVTVEVTTPTSTFTRAKSASVVLTRSLHQTANYGVITPLQELPEVRHGSLMAAPSVFEALRLQRD